MFPTSLRSVNDRLSYFLGGSGVCAKLKEGPGTFIVNVNREDAALVWRRETAETGSVIAMNSLSGNFGLPETVSAWSPQTVYVHGSDEDLAAWSHLRIVNVTKLQTLRVGEEDILLIPVSGAASGTDLVVYFKTSSVMMFGSLFYNRIHPPLVNGVASRSASWIAAVENLLETYSPSICLPGEGTIGTQDDVREFVRYLKALTNPSVEFSECRRDFDWTEIPSATSLEENFDILRGNAKTHTSLR